MSADLEFYFDPVCPWAWITSRWVTNVQQLRDYEVSWRFISLRMINAERGYAGHEAYELIHNAGLAGLRVASAARAQGGNVSVAAVYTALGNAIHVGGRREELAKDPKSFFCRSLPMPDCPPKWQQHLKTRLTMKSFVLRQKLLLAEPEKMLERQFSPSIRNQQMKPACLVRLSPRLLMAMRL